MNFLDFYFPVAEVSLPLPAILIIGLAAGIVSRVFGIGGGIISVPMMTSIGVLPSFAVAAATYQIYGSSLINVINSRGRGVVDVKMGTMMGGFGILGAVFGSAAMNIARETGNIEAFISISYAALTLVTSYLAVSHAIKTFRLRHRSLGKNSHDHSHQPPSRVVSSWPLKMHFSVVKKDVSLLLVALMGFAAGTFMVIMGIGGGMILMPIFLAILRIKKDAAIGTSILQMCITGGFTTLMNIFTGQSVDIFMGLFLMLGAMFSPIIVSRLPKHSERNGVAFDIFFAVLLIVVAIKFSYSLFIHPQHIFTFTHIQDRAPE